MRIIKGPRGTLSHPSINCTDCCVQLDIMEARAGTQPDDNNQSEESALALKEKCIR